MLHNSWGASQKQQIIPCHLLNKNQLQPIGAEQTVSHLTVGHQLQPIGAEDTVCHLSDEYQLHQIGREEIRGGGGKGWSARGLQSNKNMLHIIVANKRTSIMVVHVFEKPLSPFGQATIN